MLLHYLSMHVPMDLDIRYKLNDINCLFSRNATSSCK